MKTVFFGPFVGEFGWELLYWQGWVRKACRTVFRDHRKIVSSRPGRHVLYPDADEFVPLTGEFDWQRVSAHAYITDGWRDGLPGPGVQLPVRFGKTSAPAVSKARRVRSAAMTLARGLFRRSPVLTRVSGPDVEPVAEQMLAKFRLGLPSDAQFFVPWRENHEGDLTFGVSPSLAIQAIGEEDQYLEPLAPTNRGGETFRELSDGRGIIAIFPRRRTIRRPDKNWPKERYEAFITIAKARWPNLQIAIFGEPGGAAFENDVRDGCLDLISVPASLRLDLQIAALQHAKLALGSISGALVLPMACRVPTVIWGFEQFREVYQRANYLQTQMTYHGEQAPSVPTVVDLCENMLVDAPTA